LDHAANTFIDHLLPLTFLLCPVCDLLYGAPVFQHAHVIHVPVRRQVGLVEDKPVIVALAGTGRNIWCAFMSLVLWIVIVHFSIAALLAYMDDNFGHDDSVKLAWYEPFQLFFLRKQTFLLLLWDFIGLPHE
jgi:hypothetical protein